MTFNETSAKAWMSELKERVPKFVAKLKGNTPGFYHYSLTGDINQNENWGVGNAVFAAKTLYKLNALTPKIKQELSQFIQGFQDQSGCIYDPYILKHSLLRRIRSAILMRDLKIIPYEMTRRAETRQAFAALRSVDSSPQLPYLHIPYNKGEITRYINGLNWRFPWVAGSNVSHLLFFLHNNYHLFNVHQEDIKELIQYTIDTVNSYQQSDGSWYKSGTSIPIYQKVNGAMKMLTAFDAAEHRAFNKEKELIDLCLQTLNEGHACNHFNIICVLYYCHLKTNHRIEEIQKYVLERLSLYYEYYWPELGGFSFLKGRANSVYYNAKISEGKAEPDIHGTHLLLWGIVLISDILGWREEFGFQIPIS